MDVPNDQALIRFLDPGDLRLLVAADRSAGGRVVGFPAATTSAGEAARRAHEEHTAAHLTCVVGSCGAPLRADFRPLRGSGYRHRSLLARWHGPHAVAHQMAQQVVVDWAGGQPAVTAELDVTGAARARPDVTITLPGGERVAVEVLYGRSDGAGRYDPAQYAARVWLLGHLGPRAPWRLGRNRLDARARAVLDAGDTLAWVNPDRGLLLTLWDEGDEHGPVLPAGTHPRGHTVDALTDCVLDARHGILTPALRELDRAQEARARVARRATPPGDADR